MRAFIGAGFDGRSHDAPFDAIVVTAAPQTIPPPLLEQLALGGRLVTPVGSAEEELGVATRSQDRYRRDPVIPVRFVPMTGKAESW